jgi:site-specific DNA-methyltransferase (adenine-specific)/site-specific DNA-methyltransferase (cytosine-N4-specific)
MYPDKRGVPGCRYSNIGTEIGRSKDYVKDMVILYDFFEGEGDCILEGIFGKELSVSDGFKIKKVVKKYPEKFTSEKSFEKICDRRFDYSRLDYGVQYLNLDDEPEFDLLKSYLLKDITLQEFQKNLVQMGKVEQRIDSHEKNKVLVPVYEDVFTTENVHLIKGNNREVVFSNPFGKAINCLVGSPPYGNRRQNGDDKETETGHNMDGQEYGIYLSETYERYIPYMSKDGSIYVIIDDFRLDDGSLSCSLEYFVTEMRNKGFHLVGRYSWIKKNPMPRSYKDKDMVNGFEMVYRFSLDPKNYYCNTDLFLELEKMKNKGFKEGCTNTTGDGKTKRGSSYYQSHLKKLRNTLDKESCEDIIWGNVSNPEDFFRQEGEKRHTSTCPIYLTSSLILESTRPGDLVVDIWNGVGNTMTSSLLLNRKYVGIELNDDYFQQSCRRVEMTERMLNGESDELSQAA